MDPHQYNDTRGYSSQPAMGFPSPSRPQSRHPSSNPIHNIPSQNTAVGHQFAPVENWRNALSSAGPYLQNSSEIGSYDPDPISYHETQLGEPPNGTRRFSRQASSNWVAESQSSRNSQPFPSIGGRDVDNSQGFYTQPPTIAVGSQRSRIGSPDVSEPATPLLDKTPAPLPASNIRWNNMPWLMERLAAELAGQRVATNAKNNDGNLARAQWEEIVSALNDLAISKGVHNLGLTVSKVRNKVAEVNKEQYIPRRVIAGKSGKSGWHFDRKTGQAHAEPPIWEAWLATLGDDRPLYEKCKEPWPIYELWDKYRGGRGATRETVKKPGSRPSAVARNAQQSDEGESSGGENENPSQTPERSTGSRKRSLASSTPQSQASRRKRRRQESLREQQSQEQKSSLEAMVQLFQNSRPPSVGEKAAKLLSMDKVQWGLTAREDFEITNAMMESPSKCEFYLGMSPAERQRWAFGYLKIDRVPPPVDEPSNRHDDDDDAAGSIEDEDDEREDLDGLGQYGNW
ncbi:hypothetical protein HD553DRAFT_326700 [Filobasidium floriforme]|uniref:uncharacterized protein n=1 Tax=Filobasidium floriforme TaxID=5210 RepID=UPI001E8DFFEA|nr:uncharacterized protein HD553DRAFT_326700 [Filobasidium floriforme]KAH8078989.1 hypothetical protein HD553DRAFT_326700 [Filobasidium floriforme]